MTPFRRPQETTLFPCLEVEVSWVEVFDVKGAYNRNQALFSKHQHSGPQVGLLDESERVGGGVNSHVQPVLRIGLRNAGQPPALEDCPLALR